MAPRLSLAREKSPNTVGLLSLGVVDTKGVSIEFKIIANEAIRRIYSVLTQQCNGSEAGPLPDLGRVSAQAARNWRFISDCTLADFN